MEMYHHKGATIGVREMGDGPPMIFVHCSSASHKEWLFAADHFKVTHKCVMPDLIGYGKTSGHLDDEGNLAECSDGDIVTFLLDRLDEPADVVGHSYGAVACLEAASVRPEKVRSMFLLEPVAFYLLRTGEYEEVWQEIRKLVERITEADVAGNDKRSAQIYMSYWIGWLKWIFSPGRFKKSVIRTVPKVAYEFSLVLDHDNDSGLYENIDCPVTLVTGGKSTRAAHGIAEVLESRIPNCSSIQIAAAGHMMPFTHPNEVFDLLCRHLDHVAGKQ